MGEGEEVFGPMKRRLKPFRDFIAVCPVIPYVARVIACDSVSVSLCHRAFDREMTS